MQFVNESRSAKKLARTLEKFLASKGIRLPRGHALDALAAMQGYSDWNSLAASMTPEAVDALLTDSEKLHVKSNLDNGYENEGELRAHTGFALRFPMFPEECSYVRVVDPIGREIVFWSETEWAEAPAEVMGAIIGALVRGNARTVKPKSRQWQLDGEIQLYVKVSSSNEFAECPDWAKLSITQKSLDYLLEQHRIAKVNKLYSLKQYGSPTEWSTDEDEDYTISMSHLEVHDSGWFQYIARPKHGSFEFETSAIELKELLEVLKGPKDAEYPFCERHGDIIVWGWDEGERATIIELLRDRNLELKGFPVEQGYDGSYVENHCPQCREYESECICEDLDEDGEGLDEENDCL